MNNQQCYEFKMPIDPNGYQLELTFTSSNPKIIFDTTSFNPNSFFDNQRLDYGIRGVNFIDGNSKKSTQFERESLLGDFSKIDGADEE